MPATTSELIKIPFQGQSMWPLVEDGQSVIVEVPKQTTVLETKDVGGLFVFKDSTEWVCHRYLGKHDGRHLFKGDFSTTYELLESPVILGQVVGVEDENKGHLFFRGKNLSHALLWLQTRSVLHPTRLRKAFRYVALILTWSYKPFLYRKVQPS